MPVTFTATPTGGSAPHQYQWLVNDGNGWVPVGAWTTSRQFVWTPATAKEYFVGVRVRSAGSTAAEEASASMPFAISAVPRALRRLRLPAPVSAPVSAVTLVADKTAPQAANVPVTFTATPTGGSGPSVPVAGERRQWLGAGGRLDDVTPVRVDAGDRA